MRRRGGRKVIGFRAKRPMNYLIFEPVHRRLAADPRLDLRFFGRLHRRGERGGARRLYELAGAGPLRFMSNLRARYYPFDLYVSSDFSIAARHAARKAHLFHGVSFKNYPLLPEVLHYDAAFAVGPYMEREFVRRGIFDEGDPRLRRVGMPKLDRLLDGRLERAAILEGLGVAADRPVVLYAPTWGQESSLDRMGERVVRGLCGRGLSVVVKLHDNSYDPRETEIDWRARLDALAHPDLVVTRSPDVVPLLFAADALVSDASSAAYEFLLLDRPVVFLAFPGQLDRYRGRADLDTWGRKVGVTIEDPADLPDAVDAALARPDEHHAIRQQAARDLFYNMGSATDAAVAVIYDLLELDPPA